MTETTNPANQVKKRGTSLLLLIGFGILGIAGYFAGPSVMTYVMYLQEQSKAKAINEALWKSKSQELGDVASSPEVPPMVSAGGPGARGGARPDPEEQFKRRDEDGNGKLEGAEISERMQAQLADIDKDADGAVSKEEFLTAISRRQAPSGSSSPALADPPQAEIKLEASTAPVSTPE